MGVVVYAPADASDKISEIGLRDVSNKVSAIHKLENNNYVIKGSANRLNNDLNYINKIYSSENLRKSMYTENNNNIIINTAGANYNTNAPEHTTSTPVTNVSCLHGDNIVLEGNRRFEDVDNDIVINMNDCIYQPMNVSRDDNYTYPKMQYSDELMRSVSERSKYTRRVSVGSEDDSYTRQDKYHCYCDQNYDKRDDNYTYPEMQFSDESTVSNDCGRRYSRFFINSFMRVIKIVFYFKYRKEEKYCQAYSHDAFSQFDADLEKMIKENRKSNCTPCQFCCLVAFLNCLGNPMPPTPSPTVNIPIEKEPVNRPTSSASLTKEQYDSLYRDFKHASQMELREQMSSKNENTDQQAYIVEKEMHELIHPFMGDFFTILVEEYLKSFEEMGKGLTLLKETGITLEEICPIKEKKHTECCKKTFSNKNLASGQPYNAADFEKMLQNLLMRSVSERSKYTRRVSVGSEDDSYTRKDKYYCYCDQTPTKNNPYMTFLTEMSCHTPFFYSTEEFDQIFQTEKKGFLKDCLKLLNQYERFISKSEGQSAIFKTVPLMSDVQQVNPDMYNISVKIYNLSICHVQSVTLAFFKSIKYGGLGGNSVIPIKSNNSSNNGSNAKTNESKLKIEKSLIEYFMPKDTQFSEDKFFDHIINTCNPENEDQATPSIEYENEVKSYRSENLKHELNMKCQTIYDPYIEKEFPPLQRESLQEQPDLDYRNPKRLRYRERGVTKRFSLNSSLETTAISDLPFQVTQGEQSEVKPNRALESMKANNARVTCVLNYYKPEVSHLEAIAFLKKLEVEKGILHNPHCSETTFLTRIAGPSFHLSICCVDCRQELAPPQKVEAFKCEPSNSHPSKFMAYIMRKSRASLYFPVQCGSCGYFLCDPDDEKKQHFCVPFHSLVKSFMYPLRLDHHKCDVGPPKEYIGCLSDTINTSIDISPLATNSFSCPPYHKLMEQKTITDQTMMIHKTGNENSQLKIDTESKQVLSFDHPNSSPKYFTRSNSLPELPQNNPIIEINNNHNQVASLNFEDAVATLLNIWTYEMIDFEKGSDSADFRLNILNHRKKLSKCIKQDIIDKTYCRHILSVFKRIEDLKSPILEFKDHHLNVVNGPIYAKIVKKSQSCISKLNTQQAVVAPKSKSLNFAEFSIRLNMFNQSLLELENDAKRETLKHEDNIKKNLHTSQLQSKTTTASTSLNHRQDFRHKKVHQQQWLDTSNRDEQQYLKTRTQNRKNIVRPRSLHSELEPRTKVTRQCRSLSFADDQMVEYGIASHINEWKKELLDFQKCDQSSRPDFICHKNIARPQSLYSEIKKKTPVTHRSRSCSFVTDPAYKEDELTNKLNEWKNELLELQRSVESPYVIKNQAQVKIRPKSEPVNYKGVLLLHKNDWQNTTNRTRLCSQPLCPKEITKNGLPSEYQHESSISLKPKDAYDPKENSSINVRKDKFAMLSKNDTINSGYKYEDALLVKQKRRQRYRLTELDNKGESNYELNAWKRELVNLQKSVESPITFETPITKNPRTLFLKPEPKLRTSIIQDQRFDLDTPVAELKIWNHKLRQLENDATSSNIKHQIMTSSMRTRAASLHEEPKHATTVTKIRPKSESVLDHKSELKSWKQQLHRLEEEAKDSQPEIIKQLQNLEYTAKIHTLSSKLECDTIPTEGKIAKAGKKIWVDSTVTIPRDPNVQLRTAAVEIQNKARRLSSIPRHQPPLPDRNTRRHSHYETTGNFIPLLTDRKETRLNTHDC